MDPEERFFLVDGCPTHVHKYGEATSSTKILILIIPGNPGIATYYDEYQKQLYNRSNCSIPVWCVSHAGHVTITKEVEKDGLDVTKADERYHHLHGQVEHKLTFIKQHVPSGCKLILAGHSIGAYIILHMLKELPSDSVLKCLMLFPTVERLAQSDQGKITTPTLQYFRWLAPLAIYPLSFLPDWVVDAVLRWWFKGKAVPDCTVKATKKLVSSSSVRNITNMAHEEMQTVVEADHDLVEKYLDKLWFYYGATDHWCPVEYCEDMKARHPTADIYLCSQGYDHAFVLEASEGMAEISWNYISEKVLNANKS